MTRINCIPVKELHDKHLKAEYYELPRVFGLVRGQLEKGVPVALIGSDAPEQYTLGTGHIKFFYRKLGYLIERQADLITELVTRGVKVQYTDLTGLLHGIPQELVGHWRPTKAAQALNRERIGDRLKEMEAKKKRPVPSHKD